MPSPPRHGRMVRRANMVGLAGKIVGTIVGIIARHENIADKYQ